MQQPTATSFSRAFYQQRTKASFQKCDRLQRRCWACLAQHVCEQTFSVMNFNKNRLRSKLSDSQLRDILRHKTLTLEPDMTRILKSRSQFHPSYCHGCFAEFLDVSIFARSVDVQAVICTKQSPWICTLLCYMKMTTLNHSILMCIFYCAK